MTTINNVRVFDGYRTLEGPRDVRLEGQKIQSVRPSTSSTPSGDVVDGSGKTLVPGFFDAHVHVTRAAELRQLASWGVTTVLDMSIWSLETLRELREVAGQTVSPDGDVAADLRSAGAALAGPGSGHTHIPGFPEDSLIDTPEHARAAVRRRRDEGADYIKLVFDDVSPTEEVARAAIDEAHRLGLKVVAHAASVIAYRLGALVGPDVLTHAPIDGEVESQVFDDLVTRGIGVVPTLSMMAGVTSGGRGDYEHARSAVHLMHDAQVFTMAGTDANAAPGVPANVIHGSSLHEELTLMCEAGFTPGQALNAATAAPAGFFGLTDRGRIGEGLRADLVLLDADPTVDIANTRTISRVWTAGHPVPAKQLTQEASS